MGCSWEKLMRRRPLSGNVHGAKNHRNLKFRSLRAAAAIVMAVALGACSTLRGASSGDLTGDQVQEVNWSFADAGELQTEIDQLKGENERLKQQLAALEQQKKNTEAAARTAANASADKLRDSAEILPVPSENASSGSNGSGETIVAAANVGEKVADAKVPVEAAPRLVQPSFTSETQEIFENEAPGKEIQLSSVLYGVHLASYRQAGEARAGWRKLQRENPDELGLLEPRIERISVKDKGVFLRLIGGGFASKEKAETLCENLKSKGLYCSIAGFDGERLSLADAR